MSHCCGSDKPSKQEPACHSSSAQEEVPASQQAVASSCCPSDNKRIDYFFWISFSLVALFYVFYMLSGHSDGMHASDNVVLNKLFHMSHSVFELMNTMFIGMLIGIFMVAALSYIPRELIISVFGTNKGANGLVRATAAGLLLDLCSHGILMVGAKLYERGVSTGQVMAFLIASPWNSLSLTIILIALIGLKWTLIFIVLSAVIAIITGYLFDLLISKKVLPGNPNTVDLPAGYHFADDLKSVLKNISFAPANIYQFLRLGVKESKTVIRWLLIGIILASLIRVFVPEDYFGTYFGPTALGLAVTLIVAAVLEVCSEGSTPIAADIFNRASAPGNSFAFLMTGVATDYTEIMVLKDTTKSWRLTLFLPLLCLPQIIVVAILLNA